MKRQPVNLTQEQLKQLITYDQHTGDFVSNVDKHPWKKGDLLGSKTTRGYLNIKLHQTTYGAQRLAFLYMEGAIPERVDHIDNNPSNNSWSNLRAATPSQNSYNSQLSLNNATGVKGLSYIQKKRGYSASIMSEGKRHTKWFPVYVKEKQVQVKEAAINWLQEKRNHLHGEFANHG